MTVQELRSILSKLGGSITTVIEIEDSTNSLILVVNTIPFKVQPHKHDNIGTYPCNHCNIRSD
jgi:hypothetical protein